MNTYYKLAGALALALMLIAVVFGGVAVADGPDEGLWSGHGHGTVVLRRPIRLNPEPAVSVGTTVAPNETAVGEDVPNGLIVVRTWLERTIITASTMSGAHQSCDSRFTPGVDIRLSGVNVSVNGESKATGHGVVYFTVPLTGTIAVSVATPAGMVACGGTSWSLHPEDFGNRTKVITVPFRLPRLP